MKSFRIKLTAVALALALVASGCGKQEQAPSAGGAPGAAPGKKLKLAFVSNNAAAFWTIARSGCMDAAKALGDVEVDFRIPSAATAAEQQQILGDLLAKGEDGVALSPVDPVNQTELL